MKQQLSPKMLESLKEIIIEGSQQSIALFRLASEAILALGEEEHTGDWDPFLLIKCKIRPGLIKSINGSNDDLDQILNGGNIETATGYPEISFGDFNEADDQLPDYMNNYHEITDIIVQCQDPNNDENTIGVIIPIGCIISITLTR